MVHIIFVCLIFSPLDFVVFGLVVPLDVGLNNEGFDMLGNVLLLVSGVIKYEVIIYCFS